MIVLLRTRPIEGFTVATTPSPSPSPPRGGEGIIARVSCSGH